MTKANEMDKIAITEFTKVPNKFLSLSLNLFIFGLQIVKDTHLRIILLRLTFTKYQQYIKSQISLN